MSPLRRALETTYHLFHDHPNRKNIRIILDPDLREKLRSPAGIALPIDETIRQYSLQFQFSEFYEFDTSRMPLKSDGKYCNDWYLMNLDEQAQRKIRKHLEED